jgi:hypothetical protein
VFPYRNLPLLIFLGYKKKAAIVASLPMMHLTSVELTHGLLAIEGLLAQTKLVVLGVSEGCFGNR